VQGITIQAVYLDDQMSGWHIWNNTFYNCMTGTFIGGGEHNRFHDNYCTPRLDKPPGWFGRPAC